MEAREAKLQQAPYGYWLLGAVARFIMGNHGIVILSGLIKFAIVNKLKSSRNHFVLKFLKRRII